MENPISITKAIIHQGTTAVLQDVNLQVSEGEFVYLIGRTGSGKSSLLKTLYGELPLQEGEANIAGYNLKGLLKKDVPFLRRKLGIVFQDFHLLNDRTIEKNLEFALRATGWKEKGLIENRMLDVLEKVGLRSKLKKMPHELSGGEQQRIVIARALLNNPEIILADEPTGNLDSSNGNEVMNLLAELHREGSTIAMVTHSSYDAGYASRIVNMKDGEIFSEEHSSQRKDVFEKADSKNFE